MKLLSCGLVAALAASMVACTATSEESTSSADALLTESGTCAVANPDPMLACPMIYAPVCGCDGNTYGNACEAGQYVTSSTPGECPDAAPACEVADPDLSMMCPANYAPVCGCDGKTYGNACAASRYVTSSTPGECAEPEPVCEVAKPDPMLACPMIYAPVCGCDGKTYGNACSAGQYVTSSTPGECPEPAPACEVADPDLSTMCPANYAPVCGCDGKTYGNACAASRYVTSSTPGACR